MTSKPCPETIIADGIAHNCKLFGRHWRHESFVDIDKKTERCVWWETKKIYTDNLGRRVDHCGQVKCLTCETRINVDDPREPRKYCAECLKVRPSDKTL